MKTAFIIHGFHGDTTYTFGPWLKKFLEEKGFFVLMPEFPIRSESSFAKWSAILDTYKNYFNSETILVSHSIGNPFIIRYLYENNLKIKTYMSVAGFCKIFTVKDRQDLNEAFIDFAVNKEQIDYAKNNIKYRYSFYSDNDHVIPFNILEDFVKELQSEPVFYLE